MHESPLTPNTAKAGDDALVAPRVALAIKTVLFDYDGCAADTEPPALKRLTSVLNEMLTAKGSTDLLDLDYVLKNLTGRTCRDIIAEVGKSRQVPLTSAEVDHWVARELEVNVQGFSEYVPPSPGVNEAMADLKRLGYEMAVVSSSHGQRLAACIKTTGQDEFIDPTRVFSAQTSLPQPTPKPDPAIYLHAVKELGLKIEECVAIEDSRSGAQAANRAGLLLVGFVGTEPEERRLERADMLFKNGAKWVIDDMRKLPLILSGLARGDFAGPEADYGREAWKN